MRFALIYVLAAGVTSGFTVAAQARTCKPVAYGLYSDSKQTDGSVPLGGVVSDAVGKERAIAEWRKYVRKNVGVTYAVWSYARAPTVSCRTKRATLTKGSTVTLECRARAQPCRAF